MSNAQQEQASLLEGAIASADPIRLSVSASVVDCCWVVSRDGQVGPWRADTSLIRDIGLNGAGILRVGELLEEEHEIIITSAELMDFALEGATLGQLVDLVTAKVQAARA
ncbi:MAG: hypothetical protein K5Q68_22005 [Roseococcus sp.]|nr:hypothetical protein [Roseococcus sp.]